MKTKKLALAVVSMLLFSGLYFSSCTSDSLAPDASAVISKCPGGPVVLKDSLAADSLRFGHRPPMPGHDSTMVRPPRPCLDSIMAHHPKPVFDSIRVHHPKPVFDSIPNDTLRFHRPHHRR